MKVIFATTNNRKLEDLNNVINQNNLSFNYAPKNVRAIIAG